MKVNGTNYLDVLPALEALVVNADANGPRSMPKVDFEWLRDGVKDLIARTNAEVPVVAAKPAAADPLTNFPAAIEAIRTAFRAMAAHDDQLSELLHLGKDSASGSLITPEIAGQFLLEVLPWVDDRMSVEQKVFWTKVAAHIGPDWIKQFKLVGAFMDKVDNF